MAPTGLTKDGTWQLGVRRTAPGWSLQDGWDAGLELIEADPAASEATSRTEPVVARFRYELPAWPAHGTLQLRPPARRSRSRSRACPTRPQGARWLAEWTMKVEAAIAG